MSSQMGEFQSLIGTLQTARVRARIPFSRLVSIPYRYATNRIDYTTVSGKLYVSIPYRYATNILYHLQKLNLILVSIPYRYATN